MKTKFWEDEILGIDVVRLSQGLVLVVSTATELHCLLKNGEGMMSLRMKMLSLTMSIILDECVCYLSTIFKAWEDDFLCWVETSLRLFRIGSRLWSRNHELLLQTRLCSL